MFKQTKNLISFLLACTMIFGLFQITNETTYGKSTLTNYSDNTRIDFDNTFTDEKLEGTKNEEIKKTENINIDSEEEIEYLDEKGEPFDDEDLLDLQAIPHVLNNESVEIYNAVDLQAIKDNLNKNYILVSDIDLTGVNWEPIGTSSEPFTGTIDGQNYTIKNLTIDRTEEDNLGIFKHTKDSKFSNLNLENINISGGNRVSAFVGKDDDSEFTKIRLKDIRVTGISDVGSMLGHSYYGKIKNCSITGKGSVRGASGNVGGLVGYLFAGELEESYSTNHVIADTRVGGLIGCSEVNTIRNSYSLSRVESLSKNYSSPKGLAGKADKIENSYFAGIIAGDNREGVADHAITTTSCYYDNTITGIAPSYNRETEKTSEELTKQETFVGWDFENIWEFRPGFSTPCLKNTEMDTNLVFEEGHFYNPYKIKNATDLLKMSEDLNAYYELVNDIDLSGINFEPIGTEKAIFRGALNGNNFTIKNLTIDKTTNYDGLHIGLFGYIKDCKIENLFLKNVTVSGLGFVGGLVGTSVKSELNNVHLEDVYITGYYNVGGLLGRAISYYGTKIENVSVTGEGFVKGNNNSGGIIGSLDNESVLKESYSTISVSGNTRISGLVGHASAGTILNCYSLSKVEGPDVDANSLSRAGGLLGDGTVFVNMENCYFAGEISNFANKYGLVPESINDKVKNSYFDNTINEIGQPSEQARTTEELKQQSNFVNWDFENVWETEEGNSYPTLKNNTEITKPIEETLNFIFTIELNSEIKLVSEFANVKWISSDKEVATVTDGLIKTLNIGTTKITMIDLLTNKEDFIYIKVK